MRFWTSADGGVVQPNQTVRVGVDWVPWDIFSEFEPNVARSSTFDWTQDLIRFLGSTNFSVKLNGMPCNDWVAKNGGEVIKDGQHDTTTYQPADVAGLVGRLTEVANRLLKNITKADVLNVLKLYDAGRASGGYCDFKVPPVSDGKIIVNGEVNRKNFIFLPSYNTGNSWLTVDAQRTPAAPTIDGGYEIKVPENGSITGGAAPNSFVWPVINGRDYSDLAVRADKSSGRYVLKLPPNVLNGGKPQPLVVKSRNDGGSGVASSDAHSLTVIPELKKPEITDPKGDTVSAGQELTVSGSDGSTVTPVDGNGNPVGTSATVTNGTAKVTLNKDIAPDTKIQIRATGTEGTSPVLSDPKTVKGDTPPVPVQVFQTQALSAKPGETANATFAIKPANGDLLSLAGKKITVQVPDGFTVKRLDSGSYNVTAATGNAAGEAGKNYIWLGDDVQVTPDGKTMTFTFPGADKIKNASEGVANVIQIGVSFTATADANAAPGDKNPGNVTVDGFGSTKLTGAVK
ncbi:MULTISPECIES: hypothetical protein [Actinomycetes]|uniref:hypothetical protein n=1 Tax=Actinomycetes TaxID=1760 RepID=UPI00131A0BDA|nr:MULTISPECIES: hypothetical protein [Actinomycetes]